MALGKPAAAEPLLRRALDISIKSNGPEATDTAVLLNSLASLLLDLGRCVGSCGIAPVVAAVAMMNRRSASVMFPCSQQPASFL